MAMLILNNMLLEPSLAALAGLQFGLLLATAVASGVVRALVILSERNRQQWIGA
jgi:hypothetical protein